MDTPIFKIIEQGSPAINTARIIREGEGFVAIEVDLHSKYCEVSCHTSGSDESPGVLIDATNDSLYLDERCASNKATEIVFPRWPTYTVFAANLSRYTLNVCLVEYPIK